MPLGLIAARSLHFWAVAIVFGGAGFTLLLGRTSRHAVAVLRAAAVVAALSGIVWLALVFVGVAGTVDSLRDIDAWAAFATAPFGPPWLIRVVLLGALVVATRARDPKLYLALGVLLVLDQAWLGHAADGEDGGAGWQIGTYWLHVIAGFAWVGGLLTLCVVAQDERHVPTDGLALFSSLGLFLVVALLASGVVNAAWRGVGLADLTRTDYGRLLAIKIGLVVGMLALALTNRITAHRRPTSRTLRSTIWLEASLGLAVLVIAAMLGTTPPPT